MTPDTIHTFPLGFPWDTPDPFLFCVHHLDRYPQGNSDLGPDASLAGRPLGNDFTLKDGWRMYHGHTVPGFPAHPHCGFETVTIVTRGFCDHADSLGAAARFGEGDVQWITTGRGLQHSEMFPLLRKDSGNTLELFQIWLNLPSDAKRVEPHFRMLWGEDVPIIKAQGIKIRLIAGQIGDIRAPEPPPHSWASDPDHDVRIALLDLEPETVYSLPASRKGSSGRIYLFEGGPLQIGSTGLNQGQGAILPSGGEITLKNGGYPARLLWLQGQPISEPVAKYGPFVMNTEKEIEQVMAEFRSTRFGGWPWRHPDPVHDADRGRFARYPDGNEVDKPAS